MRFGATCRGCFSAARMYVTFDFRFARTRAALCLSCSLLTMVSPRIDAPSSLIAYGKIRVANGCQDLSRKLPCRKEGRRERGGGLEGRQEGASERANAKEKALDALTTTWRRREIFPRASEFTTTFLEWTSI